MSEQEGQFDSGKPIECGYCNGIGQIVSFDVVVDETGQEQEMSILVECPVCNQKSEEGSQ